MKRRVHVQDEDTLWYKDSIIYELHVKTFHDSNGDGIGDFRGLIQKLDYLEDLGVTAVWLLPFYPSPLRDDGYDIADYMSINPDYGDMRDFRDFLRESHRRGIRVITELVINHTSDQHPWFQRARKAKPGSAWRDFYVWSDSPERYPEARIIFVDFEPSNWTWDPIAKSYYWHRFYSHQPDLNFDNPLVQKAIFRAMDYWFDLGIDGVRLDAVPYLFERDGTNCENLPETHRFLKRLRQHVNEKHGQRMFLAEANQWPEDAASYFGDADECDMAFHFPVMPRIFMALQMEDRYPIVDILDQTPEIPERCQWALFLRNHDELTLEMVTDEERDYMYRVYASDPKARINLGIRRRLAPLAGNSRRKIELMNILLFSLPGTPIIYYGDEIGMGDNYYLGDRNGVRTPMQWSADRNAGFSKANPQKLYLPVIIDPEYHFEALNVENQTMNPSSMLWWMKRVIAMRKRFKAFSRGTTEFISCDNHKVLAFVRRHDDEVILVVINLSRFSQVVELDLSAFAGYVPEELFGQNLFPQIKESPYVFTLGFHDYFWFVLTKVEEPISPGDVLSSTPELSIRGEWRKALLERSKERLEGYILPRYLLRCRWFAGKARKTQKVRITESVLLGGNPGWTIVFLEVQYADGAPEQYLLPLAYGLREQADMILADKPLAVIARLHGEGAEGILFDASYDEGFQKEILEAVARRKAFKGAAGEIICHSGGQFRKLMRGTSPISPSDVLQADQSNTSILYGDTFFLKFYRKIDEGPNPDLEIIRFLTEKTTYSHIPPFAGALEYRRRGNPPVVLGHLQGFVPNQGDFWNYTLDEVTQYFERVLAIGPQTSELPSLPELCSDICFIEMPSRIQELLGGFYIEMTAHLGKRTAELHGALASSTEDPAFAPEPFSMLYQRSVYQSMRTLTLRVIQLLRSSMKSLPEDLRGQVMPILGKEDDILKRFRMILDRKFPTHKIRYHGDFHLGQVLFTGNDLVIIDFEGEPARPLSERRLKRSPVRDVAGMIRSYHYAVYSALLKRASVRPEDIPVLEPWADLWYYNASGIYLESYLREAKGSLFIPEKREDFEDLLRIFLLEKAIYELGYELNNRPDWVRIPVRGITQILSASH